MYILLYTTCAVQARSVVCECVSKAHSPRGVRVCVHVCMYVCVLVASERSGSDGHWCCNNNCHTARTVHEICKHAQVNTTFLPIRLEISKKCGFMVMA